MRVNRRFFLNSVCIGAPIALGTVSLPVFASDPRPCMLMLDGITLATTASRLFSFLDPILSQNIPVGCILQLSEMDRQMPSSNPELIDLLDRLRTDYPGLVEVILGVPGLADLNGYFRMRRAGDAQTLFQLVQTANLDPERGTPIALTLATELPPGDPPILDGIRSAGFQNVVLLPSVGSPADVWRTNDDAQLIFGGRRVPVTTDKSDVLQVISEELVKNHPIILVATLPDAAEFSEEEFFERGAALGDAMARTANSSDCFLTLPSDLQLRSGESYSRHLVLCIEKDVANSPLTGFVEKLSAAGIRFTHIRVPLEDEVDATPEVPADAVDLPNHTCWAVDDETDSSWTEAKKKAFTQPPVPDGMIPISLAACAGIRGRDKALEEDAGSGLDLFLDLSESRLRIVGLDKFGTLRISPSVDIHDESGASRSADLTEQIAGLEGALSDNLVLVRSSAITTEADSNALLDVFTALHAKSEISIVDLRQFLNAVSVPNEPARLAKAARRIPVGPVDEISGVSERESLLADARFAWAYFKNLTDPATGLVPATAWMDSGTVQSYKFATMWDTGTLVQAIVSAHSIGLIDDGEFFDRCSKVLANLADGRFGNLRLPKGLSSTNGRAPGDEAYNASDTSRLLTALKILESYSSRDFGIQDIVSHWDIDKTFKEGVPQTVQGGRFVSAYRSNYAGYTFRGFGLWGFEPVSPYSTPMTDAGMDADIALLHEVASLGPIGTEPHLLEAVELGFSDLARATSEALFAAQVEKYEATGKLVCISEAPINREPWFVYHGYQIGDTAEHWTTETLSSAARFKTKGFFRAIEMLNSKAAYLWHVVRPGDYSALLVNEVREKAKIGALGFTPGIFLASGAPIQEYSDINTNGVILQAIAFRLNAGTPAVSWRDAERSAN